MHNKRIKELSVQEVASPLPTSSQTIAILKNN
jgi:hypothetical protein